MWHKLLPCIFLLMKKSPFLKNGSLLEKLERGFRKFAIFPYGDIGMQVEELLIKSFGIEPWKIFDNTLCNYNSKIFSTETLKEERLNDVVLIFSTDRTRIYY